MVKQDRSLGILILLAIVTCGIYPYIFWYKYAADMNIMCDGDGDHTTDGAALVLLFLFTCGIYPYIWYYAAANRLQRNARRYGMEFSESGTTVLLWLIAGSFIFVGPFIALHIMIKNANMLASCYNSQNGGGPGFGGPNYGGGPGFGDPGYNAPDSAPDYGGQNNYLPDPQGYDNAGGYGQTQQATQAMSINLEKPAQGGSAMLTCRAGEFSGSSFPLKTGDKLTIGRELDCNIKFASNTPNVSRRHCTVEYDGNTVWLTDNNSSCGTFLTSGQKAEPMRRVPIEPGTGFYVGSKSISFFRE